MLDVPTTLIDRQKLVDALAPHLGGFLDRIRFPYIIDGLFDLNEWLRDIEADPLFAKSAEPRTVVGVDENGKGYVVPDARSEQERNESMALNYDYDGVHSDKESLQRKLKAIIKRSKLPADVMDCKQELYGHLLGWIEADVYKDSDLAPHEDYLTQLMQRLAPERALSRGR